MKNNKIDIELDMEDLLGLLPYKKDTLEYDLNFIIENGGEKYLKSLQYETTVYNSFCSGSAQHFLPQGRLAEQQSGNNR